jgi:hypothetical protein
MSALNGWLQQHAAQLENLQLSCSYSDEEQLELQLPVGKLAKLQRLELDGLKLMLPGEGNSSCSTREDTHTLAAPMLLPSLQHLQLLRVQFISISSLLQLAAGAHGLTSLKTDSISFANLGPHEYGSEAAWGIDAAAMQQVAAALPSLLQQLPGLKVIELPGMPMSDAAMQQLGGVQGLQEVVLGRTQHMPQYKLQHLPSSTTQLHFVGDGHTIEASFDSDPSLFPQLARLLQLDLQHCAFTPTVLGAFTCLQKLKLRNCALLPRGVDDDLDTEGTAALLDAVAKMTCLQDLELSLPVLDTVNTAPQRFAGLTASTHLTRLMLEPDEVTPLAKGAVQYMFPAGRQLPRLQHITISTRVEERQDWDQDDWCIDAADIRQIASCCTGLSWLDIALTVRPGACICFAAYCVPRVSWWAAACLLGIVCRAPWCSWTAEQRTCSSF